MAEWLLLATVATGVAVAIAWPLLGRGAAAAAQAPDPELEARQVRHRLALEALRDVEADHRAGSLDEEAYHRERAEAEAHAARTRAELDAPAPPATERPRRGSGGVRPAAFVAALLAGALLVGFALPAPMGIGERTVTNQALADALAGEQARRAEIDRLSALVAEDPTNAAALSDLADAYLAGGSAEDLRRAAAALILLLSVEPEDASAYRRLITAYINAGDWVQAANALDSYAAAAADDEPDIPFFRGLIAFRGNGDLPEAVRQFDRFLELAPDDPRASMIRSLRAEAAGQLETR
jgi:tetratricopeptide (TPR) repeat protein